MRRNTRNMTLAILSGATALCMCGALVARTEVSAAEEYLAFLNIGASKQAEAADTALGLSAKNVEATEAGSLTEGDTLFGSYAENGTYTVSGLSSGKRVSIALIAEEGKTLTVGGQEVSLAGKTGKTVVNATAAGETVTVEYTGKLCGILAADDNLLMTADYNPGQIIPYGALVGPDLENATAYYADGTTSELEIAYGDINAATGVNVNFTTVEVEGTITVGETQISVTRTLTTMPDDLIYFINCGSYTTPESRFPEDALTTVDYDYALNQLVFDYYGKDKLKNYGTPDQSTEQGGDTWGIYTAHAHNAPGDATFPYNSMVWTGSSVDDTHDMGYLLTDLTAGGKYRIWIGTLSHWHARTSNITFNGKTVGDGTIRIGSIKGFTVFEDIEADENGKVDIHMTQVGSENEPTINFIAVQDMATEVPEAPAAVEGATTVGMQDTSYTFTGAAEGAKVQLYNAAKPNQILYEEEIDPEKITDGSYTVDWGEKALNVSQFYVVLVSKGGTGAAKLVSITDIEGFEAEAPAAYSTTSVTFYVNAHAKSGIASVAYRLGEYGSETVIPLDLPYEIHQPIEVEENGDYYVVVTSGLGVTYSEVVTIAHIDPSAPALTVRPNKGGWKKGAYTASLEVTSVAPVVEYKLLKNGAEVKTDTAAPSVITFAETGDYVIYVKTAAGQSSASTLRVSDTPTTTLVKKSYANRTYTYEFAPTGDYEIASVTAYMVTESGTSRMTIATGNLMDVYEGGTYVVSVTTTDGTVEMFALDIAASEVKGAPKAGISEGLSLGVGLGVGVGGIVVGAAAIAVCFLVTKKKKS